MSAYLWWQNAIIRTTVSESWPSVWVSWIFKQARLENSNKKNWRYTQFSTMVPMLIIRTIISTQILFCSSDLVYTYHVQPVWLYVSLFMMAKCYYSHHSIWKLAECLGTVNLQARLENSNKKKIEGTLSFHMLRMNMMRNWLIWTAPFVSGHMMLVAMLEKCTTSH